MTTKAPAQHAELAGNLWNGALVIEVGGVRTIGKTTLTDGEARSLAARLRTASIDACRRAVELDRSVSERSPFAKMALQYSAERGSGTTVPYGVYREPPRSLTGVTFRLPGILG